jgi:GxxExxY protein
MDTNERPKMLLKEEVYSIVGAAMEVLNELGHGFNEKPYENALVIEFQIRNIPYLQQPNYQMVYKGRPVGLFIPDLIAFNGVVVDTKVIDRITDVERGQVINYLKITSCASR